MILRDGQKWACKSCITGHRSSKCTHQDRELFPIAKKGRPSAQCKACQESRAAGLKPPAEIGAPSSVNPENRCTCQTKRKAGAGSRSPTGEGSSTYGSDHAQASEVTGNPTGPGAINIQSKRRRQSNDSVSTYDSEVSSSYSSNWSLHPSYTFADGVYHSQSVASSLTSSPASIHPAVPAGSGLYPSGSTDPYPVPPNPPSTPAMPNSAQQQQQQQQQHQHHHAAPQPMPEVHGQPQLTAAPWPNISGLTGQMPGCPSTGGGLEEGHTYQQPFHHYEHQGQQVPYRASHEGSPASALHRAMGVQGSAEFTRYLNNPSPFYLETPRGADTDQAVPWSGTFALPAYSSGQTCMAHNQHAHGTSARQVFDAPAFADVPSGHLSSYPSSATSSSFYSDNNVSEDQRPRQHAQYPGNSAFFGSETTRSSSLYSPYAASDFNTGTDWHDSKTPSATRKDQWLHSSTFTTAPDQIHYPLRPGGPDGPARWNTAPPALPVLEPKPSDYAAYPSAPDHNRSTASLPAVPTYNESTSVPSSFTGEVASYYGRAGSSLDLRLPEDKKKRKHTDTPM